MNPMECPTVLEWGAKFLMRLILSSGRFIEAYLQGRLPLHLNFGRDLCPSHFHKHQKLNSCTFLLVSACVFQQKLQVASNPRESKGSQNSNFDLTFGRGKKSSNKEQTLFYARTITISQAEYLSRPISIKKGHYKG